MIRNERQYKITKAQGGAFRAALGEVLKISSTGPPGPNDELKWKLQESALRGQLADLEEELKEYENL